MNKIVQPPDTLMEEFLRYIESLYRPWYVQNRSRSRDVYEVMSERDRAEVHAIAARWTSYVTPLAVDWWKEHGYGVILSGDNSKADQYYELEAA